jgi:nucleoside-diphosphate-sugar epimerase
MKVLFIGGTGLISTAVSQLALAKGIELYHLNRGQRRSAPAGVHSLKADIHQPESLKAALEGQQFDVVVDWIAFKPEDIERDLELFRGKVKQFIFISSASAYQKPPTFHIVTESTPLHNPHWQYSRNKIACEERLMRAYREEGFPVTIVRPSHTYDSNLPIGIGGGNCYTLPDRLLKGQPIIAHGDGSSLWVVTHSEDFGRGFLGLLGNEKAIGHAFHITTDEVLTWHQIYEIIADALGVTPNIVHISSEFIAQVAPNLGAGLIGDKSWSVIFDNSKIKSFVPGFQCVIPFREGVRRTLAWFDADEKRRWINPDVNAEMDAILAAYQGK